MKRTKVKLGDLKPNPFKSEIEGGRLHDEVVECLRETFKQSGVWGERLIGRENNKGAIEIAFGHHQLKAMIQEYGKDHEIYVHISELSDDDMLRILVNENNNREMSFTAQCDAVAVARGRLVIGKTKCDFPPSGGGNSKRGRPHEHGSAECISRFYGEKNWEVSKIANLLQLYDQGDRSIREVIAPPTGSREGGHGIRLGEIGQTAALTLTRLDKPSQRVAAAILKKSDVPIPNSIIKGAVAVADEEVIRIAEPEQQKQAIAVLEKLDILGVKPSTAGRIVEAVNQAKSTPECKAEAVRVVLKEAGVSKEDAAKAATRIATAVQKPIVEARPEIVERVFKKAVADAEESKRLAGLKEGNAVAQRLLGQIASIRDKEDTLKQLVANRDGITDSMRASLIIELGKLSQWCEKYAKELSEPIKLIGAA